MGPGFCQGRWRVAGGWHEPASYSAAAAGWINATPPTETKLAETGALHIRTALRVSWQLSGRWLAVVVVGPSRGGKYLWPKEQADANTCTSQPIPLLPSQLRPFQNPTLQLLVSRSTSFTLSNFFLKAHYPHSANKSPVLIPSICVCERYSQSVQTINKRFFQSSNAW